MGDWIPRFRVDKVQATGGTICTGYWLWRGRRYLEATWTR